MTILKAVLTFIWNIISNVAYFITLYSLVLSIFGLIKFKDKKTYKPQKTFAVVIAAHNEEQVIADAIISLKKMDYPKELFDVFVVADNCTDKTALISKKENAIVYERFDKTKTGKGSALEWMFDKIFKLKKKYDAVAIFDADNIVSSNFLVEMNKKLCEGYKVVQGYLDSKNPTDTWITGSYSISYWFSNRIFQLARTNIGLSNQLGGTGFCIDTETLKKTGWESTCLTEDLAFTCRLVLNGYKVGYAYDTRIYDEKPLTMKQSWRQRTRWMQGFTDVAGRYFLKLMWKGIKEFNFVAIDCALYAVSSFVYILTGISMAATIIQYATMAGKLITSYIFSSASGVQFSLVFILLLVLQFIYVPFILILDKKLSPKVFLYYLLLPVYTVTWFPIAIEGVIKRKDKKWDHTIHTRSVHLDDIEKAN